MFWSSAHPVQVCPIWCALATCAAGMTFCLCPADFDQEKIKDGWKNIQVVQALKPVPGNGQVRASLLDCV